MYKIAITGHPDYIKKSKIGKFIKKLKDEFGPTVTILSGGNEAGPEFWVKEFALDFNLIYKEYNPSYTGHNKYSAIYESYYGKKPHISHYYNRYSKMVSNSDKLVIFNSEKKFTSELIYLIKCADKKNVPYIIID